jgi:hypothetical protein
MKRSLFALALIAAGVFACSPSFAAMGAKTAVPNTPLPSEAAFVKQVTQDLNQRFPTPAKAEHAGYFRYNNEDDTGAISYANLQWNSAALVVRVRQRRGHLRSRSVWKGSQEKPCGG